MSNEYSDLGPAVLTTPMKPVQAAKQMKLPPQYIYNWIRQGAPTHENPDGGPALVVISELSVWRTEKTKTSKPGRPKTGAGSSGIRDGLIFMFIGKPATGVSLCQYRLSDWAKEKRENGQPFYLMDLTYERGKRGYASIYSMAEKIKDGTFKPVSVLQVLEMCVTQLRQNGEAGKAQMKLVDAVRMMSGQGFSDQEEITIDLPESEEPAVEEGDE